MKNQKAEGCGARELDEKEVQLIRSKIISQEDQKNYIVTRRQDQV